MNTIPQLISLSNLTISVDHPAVKNWVKTNDIISFHWDKLGQNLRVVSKCNKTYQVLRAFYVSGGKLVSADDIPDPIISIDFRTENVNELIHYLLTGKRPEDMD